MRRLIIAVVLGLLAAFGAVGPASGASYDVGEHLHLAILNAPSESSPIPRAPYTFLIDPQTHDTITKTSYIRIDRDSGTTTDKAALVLGPGNDRPGVFSWTIDFSKWSVGRHEMRWHLERPDTGKPNNNKRQFTTSRIQVCVVSCSPSYRKGVWLGGGSWYGDYMIPLITSPRSAIVPGGSILIKSQYSNATQVCAFLNPDFHNGSHGTQLGCFGGGTATRTVSLAGAAFGDNLVIVARDAHQAGVTHVKVGDTGSTFYFETQAWWSQIGLALP